MKNFVDHHYDSLLSKILSGNLKPEDKKFILEKISDDPSFRENFGNWIQSLRIQWTDILDESQIPTEVKNGSGFKN